MNPILHLKKNGELCCIIIVSPSVLTFIGRRDRRTNITFYANGTRVKWISTSFSEWDFESFCNNCTVNDTVSE